jgi:glycosyltransferase involved in cell wall biosynthesis
MKIGIDISQIVHEGTGVASYTENLVKNLLKIDSKNQYILFGASFRARGKLKFMLSNYHATGCGSCSVKIYPIPPLILEFLWNKLHIFPIEWLIGKVDVFLSSDWLQPPTKAKKVTTIHDLIVYKYPESFEVKGGHNIVTNQKRRIKWVARECDSVLCDSKATKKDAMEILGIEGNKLRVIYPG